MRDVEASVNLLLSPFLCFSGYSCGVEVCLEDCVYEFMRLMGKVRFEIRGVEKGSE